MRIRIHKIQGLESILSKLEGHIESEQGKAYFVVDAVKKRLKV